VSIFHLQKRSQDMHTNGIGAISPLAPTLNAAAAAADGDMTRHSIRILIIIIVIYCVSNNILVEKIFDVKKLPIKIPTHILNDMIGEASLLISTATSSFMIITMAYKIKFIYFPFPKDSIR